MLNWQNLLLLFQTSQLTVFIGVDEDDNVKSPLGNSSSLTWNQSSIGISEDLGILDWERGGKVTEPFPSIKALELAFKRAIYKFYARWDGKEGYTEVTPYMVNYMIHVWYRNYPKFKDDTFWIVDTNYVLIPTAEVL